MSKTRGVMLSHRLTGPPEGAPVVLLHGFASTPDADWPDTGPGVVQELVAAGHRVIALELPGHGRSPAPQRGGVDEYLDLIDATLRSLGVADFDLVGYSLGARVAYAVLDDSRFAVSRAVLGALPAFEVFGGGVAQQLARAVAGEECEDPHVAGMAAFIASTPHPDRLVAVVEGLATTPFALSSRRTTAHVLLIAGDQDDLAGAAEALLPTFIDATYATVPGDHGAALRSEEFVGLTAEFLAHTGGEK